MKPLENRARHQIRTEIRSNLASLRSLLLRFDLTTTINTKYTIANLLISFSFVKCIQLRLMCAQKCMRWKLCTVCGCKLFFTYVTLFPFPFLLLLRISLAWWEISYDFLFVFCFHFFSFWCTVLKKNRSYKQKRASDKQFNSFKQTHEHIA